MKYNFIKLHYNFTFLIYAFLRGEADDVKSGTVAESAV